MGAAPGPALHPDQEEEQGERSGSFAPQEFHQQRTYDSTTGQWSTCEWPAPDA